MIWTAEILPHFTLGEARCKGWTEKFGQHDCGLTNLDPDLTAALSEVRRLYDKPIRVRSWTRCIDHNMEVGGKTDSYHLNGRAVDLKATEGGDMVHLREVCRVVFPFAKNYSGHIHCDVRGKRPRNLH